MVRPLYRFKNTKDWALDENKESILLRELRVQDGQKECVLPSVWEGREIRIIKVVEVRLEG